MICSAGSIDSCLGNLFLKNPGPWEHLSHVGNGVEPVLLTTLPRPLLGSLLAVLEGPDATVPWLAGPSSSSTGLGVPPSGWPSKWPSKWPSARSIGNFVWVLVNTVFLVVAIAVSCSSWYFWRCPFTTANSIVCSLSYLNVAYIGFNSEHMHTHTHNTLLLLCVYVNKILLKICLELKLFLI